MVPDEPADMMNASPVVAFRATTSIATRLRPPTVANDDPASEKSRLSDKSERWSS
jgi:hypothetical protein